MPLTQSSFKSLPLIILQVERISGRRGPAKNISRYND
jgi:hypothetical protein